MNANEANSSAEERRPLRRWLRRSLLGLGALLAIVLLAVVAAAGWVYLELRRSLPLLDGEVTLPGLGRPVLVERDGLGVPSIYAADAYDLARAVGFLHAQERFFQMDLQRRQSAGELAALLGADALGWDRHIRVHRFRDVARRTLEADPAHAGRLLEAYAEGVNQGLGALDSPPVEYLLLRVEPEPWTAEDSVLVVLSMFVQLQDETASHDRSLGLMAEVYPPELLAFLDPPGTTWDAPLLGGALTGPPIPGPEIFDLRQAPRPESPGERARTVLGNDPPLTGSNNWAVSGTHTRHGGAMLANDMHLPLSVPNIWYRAAFHVPVDPGSPAAGLRRVVGVTLPGTPSIVAGSNGRVAWGFTNTEGDWIDAVIVEPAPGDPEAYRTPDGPQRFEVHREVIAVRGGEDATVEVTSTIWGPVVGEDRHGRKLALRWTAHEPGAINLELDAMARAETVEEALEIANRAGLPAQNVMIADADGRIAWTIGGAIPRRVGCDGRLPRSWADGSCRWDGWLEPDEYPRVMDPADGRLWTANNRTVDGEHLARIGVGSTFALGARAAQIRDGLRRLDRVDEVDLLEVQLDDRALFLERWRELLLELLDEPALAGHPDRAELRGIVADAWSGRAAVDSVAYRLVRAFRGFVSERVRSAIAGPCRAVEPGFSPWLAQWEGPLWAMVTERPQHLLDPTVDGWRELLLDGVDDVLNFFAGSGEPLAEQTWGRRNTVEVAHPLGSAVPLLGSLLNMAALQLPGGTWMPRVQGPGGGASQRMVVAPGHEEDGIFHMPTGQSGHPLSPHYRDAHAAWARGEATPLLPGPPVHTLKLLP